MSINREDFLWRGLALHYGRRPTPILTLIADPDYPHLYRIRYRNGWTSTPANLSRAKDAAYDHARYLLTGQAPQKAPYSPAMGKRATA
jgi:hypothetical protein